MKTMAFRKHLGPALALTVAITLPGVSFAADDARDLDQAMLDRGILNMFSYRLMSRQHETSEASIENLQIIDSETKVARQGVLIVENNGDQNHNLVFVADPVLNGLDRDMLSGVIRPGQRWGAQFNSGGRYEFHCTLHPDAVTGAVIVE